MKILLTLVPILIIRAIASLPRMAANSVGLGYTSEYTINGKVVKRPERFKSKAHKAAFERIGDYITDALTRDFLESFRDSALQGERRILSVGHLAPLEVWHEVLEFFREQECLQRYWRLQLPMGPTDVWTGVNWGPDGEELARPKSTVIGGTVVDPAIFSPYHLTDTQKQEILTKGRYATSTVSSIGTEPWQKPHQVYAQITEGNFETVYYRPRMILSEEDNRKGSEKLRDVFTAMHK